MSIQIPDIKEELERKTFQTLETLISNYELGKITSAEYNASINTLFSVCSGLVDGDFFKLISLAGKEVKKDFSFARNRVFRKLGEDNVKVVSRIKNKGEFTVVIYHCLMVGSKLIKGECDHLDTNEDTEELLSNMARSLIASGYSEIVSKE